MFAVWRRPWRIVANLSRSERWLLVALGVVLAAMNACFYEAIARVPLGTVGAVEFLGQIALAATGARTRRNFLALALAVGGVWLLTDVRVAGQPIGFAFAFANCGLFVLYVVLGHRIARDGGSVGIDRLGAAMLVAFVAVFPLGFAGGAPTFAHPELLFAGIAVGICSSVIPYICDQLAMAQLPRPTFALMLSLLPAFAVLIGVVVLRQIPRPLEMLGVALVIGGVAIHRTRE